MGDRVIPAAGVLTITNARVEAAAALAPVADDDPEVYPNLVDAVDPPALMVGWGDPWIDTAPATMGRTLFRVRLVVWAIAGRLEPDAGVEMLERLVGHVVGRLADSPYPWGLPTASAPAWFTFGNVDYIAARVTYLVPVSTSEDSP